MEYRRRDSTVLRKETRIMMVGPSGVGKTTLAKFISEKYNLPFISGSYSDLIPETREVSHKDMVKNATLTQENQLLSLRSKAFHFSNGSYVTDRSYIDDLAYLFVKLSNSIEYCDFDTFELHVRRLLIRDCTHLVFIPFTKDMIHTWKIEDNNKRVLNPYFQYMVSKVMEGIIADIFGVEYKFLSDSYGQLCVSNRTGYTGNGKLTYKPERLMQTKIKSLILSTTDLDTRKKFVSNLVEW